MRHATPATLETISDLLADIRGIDALTERKPGIFYRKSAAFLHFHEDPAGVFADVKLGKEFERIAVNTTEEQVNLLASVRELLEPVRSA